jgi:hypothetical protein
MSATQRTIAFASLSDSADVPLFRRFSPRNDSQAAFFCFGQRAASWYKTAKSYRVRKSRGDLPQMLVLLCIEGSRSWIATI